MPTIYNNKGFCESAEAFIIIYGISSDNFSLISPVPHERSRFLFRCAGHGCRHDSSRGNWFHRSTRSSGHGFYPHNQPSRCLACNRISLPDHNSRLVVTVGAHIPLHHPNFASCRRASGSAPSHRGYDGSRRCRQQGRRVRAVLDRPHR